MPAIAHYSGPLVDCNYFCHYSALKRSRMPATIDRLTWFPSTATVRRSGSSSAASSKSRLASDIETYVDSQDDILNQVALAWRLLAAKRAFTLIM